MSQHDYNIANGGGAAVRSDINTALAAILSQNSGATAPTVTKPYMFWFDTANSLFKQRNADDTSWVVVPLFVGTSSGRAGFGIDSPLQKLVIAGESNTRIQVDGSVSGGLYLTQAGLDSGTIAGTTSSMILYAPGTTESLRLVTGGVVELTSGKLKFPGTQAASSDANTLDDYEEGTWTPSTSSAGYTISASYGSYTKIGRLVTLAARITFSSIGSGTSGVIIQGVPFTANNSIEAYAGACRENTATGTFYVASLQTAGSTVEINSMDGVTPGSQRTLRTGESYIISITYNALN